MESPFSAQHENWPWFSLIEHMEWLPYEKDAALGNSNSQVSPGQLTVVVCRRSIIKIHMLGMLEGDFINISCRLLEN